MSAKSLLCITCCGEGFEMDSSIITMSSWYNGTNWYNELEL